MIEKIHNFLKWADEVTDPRTKDWPLIASPWPVCTIVILYVLSVKYGPRFMAKREPLDMKYFIIIYNLVLVGMSAYMFYEFLMTSLLSNYSLKCQPIDFSSKPLPMRMASAIWWFFISKIVEILDTVFFILRKKDRQLTFLHTYHHFTMIVNCWLGVRYIAGGQTFMVGLLNSFVHVLMYGYYGLAAFGPHMQKYLWWKRYLTRLQLVQFCAFLLHTGYNLTTDCDYPRGFNLLVFLHAFSLVILFGDFYYKNYTQRQKTVHKKQ